jgi:hypothetical protein
LREESKHPSGLRETHQQRQGSISFLKKETKTFARRSKACGGKWLTSKSFLVLFFKKELLPSHLPSFL